MRAGVAVQSIRLATTACAMTGALGRRGFALESAAARVCREANVMFRDLDLPVQTDCLSLEGHSQ